MRIDRRLTLLGVMLVVLSTVMATQYATTKVGYSYSIVHPSNADIRFVGSDNSSDDGLRVLRIDGSNGTSARVTLELGDWSAGANKTYTAAFAIVNEEGFAVNITNVRVLNATTGAASTANYLQIWLHGNGSKKATDDTSSVYVYNNGTSYFTSTSTAWAMAHGDGVISTMRSNISTGHTQINTGWDHVSNVRFTLNLSGNIDDAVQANRADTDHTLINASDFVWVQISLNIPRYNIDGKNHTGVLEFNFKATTQYGQD